MIIFTLFSLFYEQFIIQSLPVRIWSREFFEDRCFFLHWLWKQIQGCQVDQKDLALHSLRVSCYVSYSVSDVSESRRTILSNKRRNRGFYTLHQHICASFAFMCHDCAYQHYIPVKLYNIYQEIHWFLIIKS